MTQISRPPDRTATLEHAGTALLWALFIGIGALQREHIRLGFVTAYGADVACPALLYVTARQGRSLLRHLGLRPDRPLAIAAGVFALSTAWEVGQGVQWIPGVYDSLDIAAYAVGVGVPYVVDRWLQCKSTSNLLGADTPKSA